MKKTRILVIDDDESIREQMKWALTKDYDVITAGDRGSAKEALKKRPLVATLDLGLPPEASGSGEGMRCLDEILQSDPFIKVIIITGNTDKENALKGVAKGAYDFLLKPADMDELKVILKRAVYLTNLERENRDLQLSGEGQSFETMLGTSPSIQDVFATIRKVATTDAPVLITGESGTGKELVARAIHNRGTRKDGPFIPINCGAIPENLLESELFGYEKGSFTGAHAQKRGKIELANEGTIFFDEIGELPLQLQVKLLRFLQDRIVERVGGTSGTGVDVRVLAATNRDLKKAIEKGAFRDDLYFRLAVINIELPPLRERKEDLMLCASAFLQRFAKERGASFKGFSDDASEAILNHSWSGNVRELENRIRRAIIMAEGKKITAKDLAFDSLADPRGPLGFKEAKEMVEKDVIRKALLKHGGNVTKASKDLGISRPTLYDMLKKYGMEQ